MAGPSGKVGREPSPGNGLRPPDREAKALDSHSHDHRERVVDHLVADLARAFPDESAGRVRERLAAEQPACVEIIAVAGPHGRLQGVVTIGRLFAAPAATPVAEVMDRDYPTVHPEDDQEHAASVALHHAVDALPVADASGALLGVMPPRALLQDLRREHVEDLHRLTRSGIGHLVAGELRTGALIGAVLGALAFVAVWSVYGDVRLAGAVGAALFAAGTIASGIGIAFPWWLARMRMDPAYGSGPMATVLQDTLSILVYLVALRAFGF